MTSPPKVKPYVVARRDVVIITALLQKRTLSGLLGAEFALETRVGIAIAYKTAKTN